MPGESHQWGTFYPQIKREALKKISSMSRSNKTRSVLPARPHPAIECLPAFPELYPDIEILSRPATSMAKGQGRSDHGQGRSWD